MATEQIVVQVTLDNGQVLKGFAQIEQSAKNIQKATKDGFATKAVDEFSDSVNSSFGGISRLLNMIPGPIKLVLAGVYALKKTFDFSKEGEQIIALEKRFDILAQREGINAQKLKDAFEQAGGGLVSLNDLFQSASRSIAIFGSNAERLPELLDLSRKASTALGTDTVQTFEDLSKAIETGNKKALKNAGIIVDVDKVYQDFAKTLGLLASELTESQKQAALLEAVLKTGAKTYAGITSELTPLANAQKALGVAMEDSGEKFKSFFSVNLSNNFAAGINSLTALIKGLSGNNSTLFDEQKTKLSIENTKAEIQKLQEFVNANKDKKLNYEVQFESSAALTKIAFFKQELASLEKSLQNSYDINRAKVDDDQKAAARRGDISSRVLALISSNEKKLTDEQLKNIQMRKGQVDASIVASEMSVIASREKLLQFETDADTKKIIQQDILNQKLAILDQEKNAKLQEINKTFSDANGFSEAQRDELRLAAARDFALKRTAIEYEGNVALQAQAKKTEEIQKQVSQSVNSFISTAVQSIGRALVKGMSAFDEAKKMLLNILGDMMINIGMSIVATSTAITALKNALTKLAGPLGIAGGLALIALGGALKASGDGGLSSAATSTSGGGENLLAGTQDTVASNFDLNKSPGTIVNLTVEGSIMDTPETGLRLSRILSDSFQNQGTTLVNA